MQKLVFLSFFLLSLATSNAQPSHDQDLQSQVYQAYISSNVTLWEKAIVKVEDQFAKSSTDAIRLELARLEYGIVGICMGSKEEKKAKEHLGKAEKHAEAYLKTNKTSAEGHALMSGILGFKIAFAPMKGMWLGPRSNSHLSKAMKNDKTNAQAWKQKGNSLLHTPAAFGGDVKKSIKHYVRAIELYESQGDLTNNWEYIDALAWLGQAYHKDGQLEKAKSTYSKALEQEPNAGWVKYVLLPKAEKVEK